MNGDAAIAARELQPGVLHASVLLKLPPTALMKFWVLGPKIWHSDWLVIP